MDLTPPRGTADLLPPASERMWGLYAAAARTARLYGYRYVETPVLQHTDLFVRTSGGTSDVVSKEMYTFDDRGGRSLTLRPEGTAPVMRAYLAHAHDVVTPFRAFYLDHTWRYGRPQAGRLREFRVFGTESIGTPEADADAEVIEVAWRFLRERGLGRVRLELNSIGDDTCRPPYREELVAFLGSNVARLRDEHRDRFADNPMRVLDCKDEMCRAVAAEAPKISERLCAACKEHFEDVQAELRDRGIAFVHEQTLVRGLDYYTRTAFEFVSEALDAAQSTVCGGGRYDGLAEVLGGPPTPGVGFGLGLDRVALAVDAENAAAEEAPPLHAVVVALGGGAQVWARQVAAVLRDRGLAVSGGAAARPLKAQLRIADRSGALFALIVGEQEARAGTVTVRRLEDGRQQEMGLDDAVAWVATVGDAV